MPALSRFRAARELLPKGSQPRPGRLQARDDAIPHAVTGLVAPGGDRCRARMKPMQGGQP